MTPARCLPTAPRAPSCYRPSSPLQRPDHLAFARRHLFGPLGIATHPAAEPVDTPENLSVYLRAGFAWARDPQGYHIGGGTLKLTSPDLAKLGYLYLNQGRWDRTQVVPADYVGASTRTHSVGRDNASYGYHWWVETVGDHAASSPKAPQASSSRWSPTWTWWPWLPPAASGRSTGARR